MRRREPIHRDGPGVDPLTPLLTLPEVAALLRVSEKTIRRLAATRRLPCLRIGSRLRFDHRDVLRWVSARKEG